MAKVRNNIITQGLSGRLGDQIVFRQGKGGETIVAVRPAFDPNRGLSTSQLAHQDAFRQAIAYAKTAKEDSIYITKANGTALSSFNAAVADWFNKPQVLEIDASDWTGQPGQTIRVMAMDDTQVARVSIVIKDENGAIKEQGLAVESDGLWWSYTTTTVVSNPSTATISATAEDLPGNSHGLVWQNN